MRELTYVEPGKVEFREKPDPQLQGDGEAIVRPIAVSRCDLDYAIARGKAPVSGPFALGHECVAEVVAIGDAVRRVGIGDRVIVPFQISCGACAMCVRGLTGSCKAVPKLSSYGLAPMSGIEHGGAASDLLRVPFADAMLVPLPAGIDPKIAAALGDNAVDGFRSVREGLSAMPGASVLVAAGGAPSVGLYAVAAARALGAGEVVYVDPSAERIAIAEKLGARGVREKCTPDLRLGFFPITVDATAREEGLRFALGSTDVEGLCTSIGIYFGDVALPMLQLYTRGIRFVTGRVNARNETDAALSLAQKGTFDLGAVATTILDWEEAPRAWLEPATKVVIHRN